MTPPAIIEGFALETDDGLIFTVKGLVHPPDRVIAYLRYLPDPAGDRRRAGQIYRRVYRFTEQQEILHSRYPLYLSRDPALGFEMQSVPRARIRTIFEPVARLAELRQRGPADDLEAQSVQLADRLLAAANVSPERVGVSGSVLFGLHTPASDIDLIVYGAAAGRAVHRALCRLLADSTGPLRRLNQTELAELYAAHHADTPLLWPDFVRLQSRKVNELRFGERPAFIRFVPYPAETGAVYGADRVESLGLVTVQAMTTDDRAVIFTPCRYGVTAVEFLDGPAVENLTEIVSFRGRFSDQARVGERLSARGALERVTSAAGAVWHRLVVGGQAGDYLLAEEAE